MINKNRQLKNSLSCGLGRLILALAFAVLPTVFGATTAVNAQATQIEPSALINELKGRLSNAPEEQVTAIVEKWNAREDLAGK